MIRAFLVLLLTTFISNTTQEECECGLHDDYSLKAQGRIWNGDEAQKHRYPWMVWLNFVHGVSKPMSTPEK